MNDKVYVGIDCGDLELKVVYVVERKSYSLPLPPEARGLSIYFDPHAKVSNMGVGFPSILQKVGTHVPFKIETLTEKVESRTETSDSIVKLSLAAIHQSLLKVMGKPVGAAVLAVSAMLSQSGRKALLDCAKAAGFDEATLIDKCTAAALGYHSNREKPATALILDLSYGDCEYSLLRLARERCRVIASGSAPGLSGERLNSLVMEATVLALRKQRIFLGLKQFTSQQWLGFRRLAEEVRLALAEQPETLTTLTSQLTGVEKSIQIRYQAQGFAAKAAQLMGQTIDGIHGILEQNSLEIADLDVLLLVGDVAKASPVYDILSHTFRGKPQLTDPNLVAIGAAWQATQNAEQAVEVELPQFHDQSLQPAETSPLIRATFPLREADAKANLDFAEVIEYEPPAVEPSPPPKSPKAEVASEVSLEAARKLIEQGRRQEASAILAAVAQELEALRSKLQQDETLAVPRMLIHQAQAMINTGNILNAVSLTHEAYAQAPTDPEVFAGMMKIHEEASFKLDRPEEYEAAIKILSCAHNHDQTDRSIHKAMAERHYLHAVAMRNLNNLSKALAITNIALSFDPKHPGANQLLQELTDGTTTSSSP